MSGGSGTRLWPLSRRDYPKQFLALNGDATLLQETLKRVGGGTLFGPPVVACAEAHRFIIAEQMRAIDAPPAVLLLEPVARSTAAVAALAALWLLQNSGERDPLFLLMPTDHVVGDATAFRESIRQAARAAAEGWFVAFGILPQKAETGYGYIKPGKALLGGPVAQADSFIEKPGAARAEACLREGYLWNAGLFLFSAKAALKELEKLQPAVVRAARDALAAGVRDLDFFRLDRAAFEKAPSISIDCALMERTQKAAVMPAAMDWNDIGSWQTLWDTGRKDAQGNVVTGDALLEDTRRSLVHSEGRLAVTLGLENILLVARDDVVLAADLSRAADVKTLVARLDEKGRGEARRARRAWRPWGWFEPLGEGHRFQVKRIFVKPGGALSLQMHHHRSEHWVVVAGAAQVRRGAEELFVYENQSVYIPAGTPHRLSNSGKVPLVLIEVQSGAYLGEDDIIRLDDHYGRAGEKNGDGKT